MHQAAVGIDIGGTFIKSGLIGSDGRILVQQSTPTEAAGGREALLSKIVQIVHGYENYISNTELELIGVGIGTAGYVNLEGEIGSATESLPGWQGTPVKAELQRRISLPVYVDNDVNAVALGESWTGAGRNRDQFICLALGTGVGGCFIYGGKPYRGKSGYAGAYGHQVIAMDGQPCACGLKGCWEQYASVTALKRIAREMAKGAEWSSLPENVFAEARKGNETAVSIVDQYALYISIGIAGLMHSFNPTAVIIGGAVTAQGDFLFDRIRSGVRKNTMHGFAEQLDLTIIPAQLGNMAGTVGAAKLVWLA
ncbi:ROK family protein [Paenibacillus nasutitermitis]|uniref:Glucokinase n=1 Tax=Paenibacillus nasutitermitis TaxID=1652958 RepID=A0A916ZFI4_9BACL|nr:ROK family protein [Paenibacillus nasutitermitis]GGD94337.1 glucokinase [Paenibacillus nasutitermitis]